MSGLASLNFAQFGKRCKTGLSKWRQTPRLPLTFIPCVENPGRRWAAFLIPSRKTPAFLYGDHVFFETHGVLITNNSEGGDLALAVGSKRAAILCNHGPLTVGKSVNEAAWWYIAMERRRKSQFLAESVGKPLRVDPESARATHAVSGLHFAARLHFQTFWHRIVSQQPDLFV